MFFINKFLVFFIVWVKFLEKSIVVPLQIVLIKTSRYQWKRERECVCVYFWVLNKNRKTRLKLKSKNSFCERRQSRRQNRRQISKCFLKSHIKRLLGEMTSSRIFSIKKVRKYTIQLKIGKLWKTIIFDKILLCVSGRKSFKNFIVHIAML